MISVFEFSICKPTDRNKSSSTKCCSCSNRINVFISRYIYINFSQFIKLFLETLSFNCSITHSEINETETFLIFSFHYLTRISYILIRRNESCDVTKKIIQVLNLNNRNIRSENSFKSTLFCTVISLSKFILLIACREVKQTSLL